MAKRRGGIRASRGAQPRTAPERAWAERRLREARGVVKKAVGALRQRDIGLRVTGESEVMPLVAGIREVARRARSEEDLRVGVEGLLRPALRQLGVEAEPRYEKSYAPHGSILRGRSDAVYGHLVIEYEPVGALARRAGVTHAAKQLDGYVRAEVAGELGREPEPRDLRRAIGVGLDGERLFFLRYRGDRAPARGEEVETRLNLPLFPDLAGATHREPVETYGVVGPFVVGDESVQQFLLYARALRRRPLTAQALADEFGPKGKAASRLVSALYEAVQRAEHPKVRTFFREWDRIFGIVYGQDLAKAQRDAGELAEAYGIDRHAALKPLLFAVHTYYALFMKLLAAELASLQRGALISSFVAELPALPGRDLRRRLDDLENGGLFARLGIRNFLEADFFGWYLVMWRRDVENGMRELARALLDFEPATGSLEPSATRDLLKRLYQYLVPKKLRHDLGEYYTPDWLAELVMEEAGFDGDLAKRVLDPACGSGTFLVLAIRRAQERADEQLVDPREAAKAILDNVIGFDLNPLAVISARTNYLLALGTLVRFIAPLEIPVYLCDSVLTPWQQRGSQMKLADDYTIPSTEGEFHVPRVIVTNGELPALTRLLEECARAAYKPAEFRARARRELSAVDGNAEATLDALYRKIAQLEREEKNGIWARLIKNEFAPVFAGTFDYVLGNPPWVRWGYLSDEYRHATRDLWIGYGLFSLKGMAARLGAGEKDFSMLFVYACADTYLRDAGVLGFVITQEVLKSKGAGEGFRRFRLGQDGAHLRALKAHDLVDISPFERAGNKTAALVLRKGEPTTYPIPYTVWRKRKGVRIDPSLTLAEVRERTERRELMARPISADPASAWQTSVLSDKTALDRVKGSPAYKARVGARLEPYGVFWLRLESVRADSRLVVTNLPEEGKRRIRRVEAVVEPRLVFPIVRGADVARWAARPQLFGLVTQDPDDRVGYAPDRMKAEWPHTFAYLRQFERALRQRAAFKKYYEPSDPYWSQFNISRDTFSSHRVAWKRMATDIFAAVVSSWPTPFGERPLVALDTTTIISTDDADEAHYLCALLNSAPLRAYVRSFSSAGRGFGAPSVISNITLPKFDSVNATHRRLAELSRRAHDLAAADDEQPDGLRDLEAEVDREAAALWGIADLELAAMRAALTESRRPREPQELEPQVSVRQEVLPLVETPQDQGWLPTAVRFSAEVGPHAAQEQRRESEGAEAQTPTAKDGRGGRTSRVSL